MAALAAGFEPVRALDADRDGQRDSFNRQTARMFLIAMNEGETNTASPGLAAETLTGDFAMPAKSKSQQKAAGAALSAKRGETKKSELKGAARGMEESMTEKQLHDMASGKRKGKPEHASKG